MIGKTITDLLKANAALLELVPSGNIFPYVANEKTKLPLIVYNIESLDPDYTKDGWAGDYCNFNIISIAVDYSDLQLIVAQVREAIELASGSGYQAIRLTGMAEGYNQDEEAFMNKLSFRIKITN
jgi:flagellar biosynthesis/type III secretory pathway protein FliH